MKVLARIVASALMLVSLPCSAQQTLAAATQSTNDAPEQSTKWERFSPAGEEFAVFLPQQPSLSNFARPKSIRNRVQDGRLYSTYRNGTVYVIISIDNTGGGASLQTIRDEIFTNEEQQILVIDGAERSESKVTRHGVKGIQYRSSNANISSISEFYAADNHIYFFGVYSEDINEQAVKQFLSSIAVGSKAMARKQPDLYQPPTQGAAPSASSGATGTGVFTSRDVTRKAIVVTRAKTQYTEEARQNAVEGTVVLRAILASTGDVTNIEAIRGLPDGLTEKAIAAARNISFIPAKKEGRFVSQYIQIEYNFNLY